jgi:hypothetical protein
MAEQEHNMDHLNHIDAVAASDCAVLRSKEATYQGSWKRAGGRSAWFMARRNLDRLLTMMAAKPQPDFVNPTNVLDTLKALRDWVHYNQKVTELPGSIEASMAIIEAVRDSYTADDIFAKIEEKPKGEDGTVLAVIRDLRRYLILVEAEMVSRGVVEQEVPAAQAPAQASRRAGAALRGGMGKDGVMVFLGDDCTWTRPEDNVTILVKVVDVTIDGCPVIGNTNMESRILNGWSTLRKDNHAVRVDTERRVPRHIATPEAGSQHAALFPWEVMGVAADTMRARIGDELFGVCYNLRGPGHYRLEPVILSHRLPRELASVYTLIVSAPNSLWLLKRGMIPPDLQGEYPRLQVEMNAFEYDTSPSEYKSLYLPVNEKWILQQCYMEWAAES